MNVHENARPTPRGREILVSRLERGEHPQDVATAMSVSASTVYKWWRRYRAEGVAGLPDRSSRPDVSRQCNEPDGVETKVIALRRERRIYHRIAAEAGVSRATVGRILTRHGAGEIELDGLDAAVVDLFDARRVQRVAELGVAHGDAQPGELDRERGEPRPVVR